MVIHRTDRVLEVLRRDERLIDTFIGASPVFAGLRNPLMRRTMGRLATVEQAARVAGIDADSLVEVLNRALARPEGPASSPGGTPAAAPSIATGSEEVTTVDGSEPPAALAAIPAELIADLDVREDLRNGQEPFSRIMAARRDLPEGGALRLRAIFEPVPLYLVMAKQGFDHWTEMLGEEDWRVTFFPKATEAAAVGGPDGAVRVPAATPGAAGAREANRGGDGEGEEEVIVLDVRGMEPPEPMVRTLAALETLPPGKTLLQINERVPQFLLPKLEELGFTYQLREQDDALVRVFIRRREHA